MRTVTDVIPPSPHPTPPKGAALGALLLAGTAALVLAGAPAATARAEAEAALRESVGCPVRFQRARYRPGRGVVLTGGHIGTPAEPLQAGGPASDSGETVEVRDVLVRLPGGGWMAHAFGTLWRTDAGAAFDLTGRFRGFGMEVPRCRVEVRGGGRTIRIAEVPLLSAEPGGVKLGAAGVQVELEGQGDPIAGWRGRIEARRFHVRGVPGTTLTATVEVRTDGRWVVSNGQASLCGGPCTGRAAYTPGAAPPLALQLAVRHARLDGIPPSATAGAGGLEGLVSADLDAALGGGASSGTLAVTGQAVEFGDAPAFLTLLRSLQFRLSSALKFDSLALRAAVTPDGLQVTHFDLPGRALSLALSGPGRVGWGGQLDLPVEVRGNRGVFGELPVVGGVLQSRTPIVIDVRLGGTLAAPDARAGTPRRTNGD